MSRKMTFTAVSVLMFSLVAFSTHESGSRVFARGGHGGGHGHVGRGGGRARASREFARRSNWRVGRGWGWGGGWGVAPYYSVGPGYGSCAAGGTCPVDTVVQTADGDVDSDGGSDMAVDGADATPVVTSDDGGDPGSGSTGAPGYWGWGNDRGFRSHHNNGRPGGNQINRGQGNFSRGGGHGQVSHFNRGGGGRRR